MANFWKTIWDEKGEGNSTDLLYLDGYEHLDIPFDSKDISISLCNLMDIQEGDKLLEVGCGCGFLSREFQSFDYEGIDYSESLIDKHLSLFPSHKVKVGEANSLAYSSSYFDKVFCFGVFQYFPSLSYADKVIEEMKRVSKDVVFLGDLKNKGTREEHFVYPRQILLDKNFSFSKCVYDNKDKERYNALFKG